MAEATTAPPLQTPDADPDLDLRVPGDEQLRAAWLARHPRPVLSPSELRRLRRNVVGAPSWTPDSLIKGQTSSRPRTAMDVEVDWLTSCFPDWRRQGKFVTLTVFQGTTRQRLLECHERWTQSISCRADKPVCQYRVIDVHQSGTSHLHLLLFGASDLSDDLLAETWRAVARIPRRQAGHACLVEPLTTDRRLYYSALRALMNEERDELGPWPVCTKEIAPPDREDALDALKKALRRRGRHPGRPMRELIEALSWLRSTLGDGRPRQVSTIRRRMVDLTDEAFSYKTLLKAKRLLDVVCFKRGRYAWSWALPGSMSVKSDEWEVAA